jgi:hypothetical protein
MKHDKRRSVTRFALFAIAVSIVVPNAAHSMDAADAACTKLARHESAFVIAIHVADGIYWNGTKVTHAQFDTYLRKEAHEHPQAVFHVTWERAKQLRAEKLLRVIHSHDFKTATDCSPFFF